jgi:hypothetical protein
MVHDRLSPAEREAITRRLAEIAAEQDSIPACSSALTGDAAKNWDQLYIEMLDLEERLGGSSADG